MENQIRTKNYFKKLIKNNTKIRKSPQTGICEDW